MQATVFFGVLPRFLKAYREGSPNVKNFRIGILPAAEYDLISLFKIAYKS